jgi:hypothetical protein
MTVTQARRHQDEWATYLKVPVEYTNSIGMKFWLIPPGEFTMGSTAAEIEEAVKVLDASWKSPIESEGPAHKVILTQPTYIGIYEVTQAEYAKVMGTNPSHFSPTGDENASVAGMETSSFPVEWVSWKDAAEFCAKLSMQEKMKPFYLRDGDTITMGRDTACLLRQNGSLRVAQARRNNSGSATRTMICCVLAGLVRTLVFARMRSGS